MNEQLPEYPAKYPSDVLDYYWDFAKFLGTDTISDHSVTATGGVAVDSHDRTGSIVTMWLSGGNANRMSVISIEITTVAGRDKTQKISLKIRGV